MNDLVPAYAMFSIAALAAKLLIVWFGWTELRSANGWFLAFFLSLFGVNFLELTGFYYPSSGKLAIFLMTSYYECVLIGSIAFLGTALAVTECSRREVGYSLSLALTFGTIVLCWPGAIIADVTSIGYTSTRVPGPLYWIFQILLIGSLSASVAVLAYHSKSNKAVLIRRKAKALLISIAPIFIVALLVVGMMHMGIEITGSVFGSFAILLFVIMFIRTNDRHQLFTFLSYVPITSEFRLVNRVRDAACKLESLGLQQTLMHFEALLVTEALAETGGNKTSAAEKLGISRTTLRRKLQNY